MRRAWNVRRRCRSTTSPSNREGLSRRQSNCCRSPKWMVVEEKDQSHVLLKPPVRPVTIRHLLSHTSGLAGSSELQQVTGSDSTSLKARSLSSVTVPLQWQPGDKYQDGNQGMNNAAPVVEIV